jgi:hypothetical protein
MAQLYRSRIGSHRIGPKGSRPKLGTHQPACPRANTSGATRMAAVIAPSRPSTIAAVYERPSLGRCLLKLYVVGALLFHSIYVEAHRGVAPRRIAHVAAQPHRRRFGDQFVSCRVVGKWYRRSKTGEREIIQAPPAFNPRYFDIQIKLLTPLLIPLSLRQRQHRPYPRCCTNKPNSPARG